MRVSSDNKREIASEKKEGEGEKRKKNCEKKVSVRALFFLIFASCLLPEGNNGEAGCTTSQALPRKKNREGYVNLFFSWVFLLYIF